MNWRGGKYETALSPQLCQTGFHFGTFGIILRLDAEVFLQLPNGLGAASALQQHVGGYDVSLGDLHGRELEIGNGLLGLRVIGQQAERENVVHFAADAGNDLQGAPRYDTGLMEALHFGQYDAQIRQGEAVFRHQVDSLLKLLGGCGQLAQRNFGSA